MKISKLLLCSFFFFSFVTKGISQNSTLDSITVRKVFDLADAVRREYAPDQRTAIFQILKDSAGNHYLETTEQIAAQKFSELLVAQGINPVRIKNLPTKDLGETTSALVNLSVVNIRSNPRNAAELATQSLLGTPLDILKKDGYYYLVRTPDGYISWLDAGAISLKTSVEMTSWTKKDKLIFIDDFGHAYANPDKKSQRVSDLVMGNILVKEGLEKGFYKVIFPDGRVAFISQEQMTDYSKWIKKASPNSDHVLDIAKTMIGVPYLWGGTSVKGVDCSGFTKTAFFMTGVIIPRDASQQVLVGEPVSVLKNDELNLEQALKNLKAGDLIFFAGGKNRPSSAKVTHVALYLGNGEFIHSAGKVRINSMKPEAVNYDDFETRTVVAARRYIGNISMPGITPISKHTSYIQK